MKPLERLRWLASNGLCLGNLTSELTDPSLVTAFLAGESLWIGSEDFGLLRADRSSIDIEIFPVRAIGDDEFRDTFVAAWIPQVQQFRGRQVLHASTLLRADTHRLIVFSGDKESGKSTFAFGLAQKQEWQQLGDDMLVFEAHEDGITIIPYPETPRLRPQSSAYFGIDGADSIETSWPAAELSAELIYTLEPSKILEEPVQITALTGAKAYTPLLRQAFNIGLELPDLNRRLIGDYAALTNRSQVFELRYRQEIDLLPQILEVIEVHASRALEALAADSS